MHRKAQTVFWPGYTVDVKKRREGCHTCNSTAPTQQQVPVRQSEPPTTPFKSMAADFFDLAEVHNLVRVDRLSGWIDITRAAPGSAGSGAKGLMACLYLLFANKGIPEQLSSDGGTEFMAGKHKSFSETGMSATDCLQSTSRSRMAERKWR